MSNETEQPVVDAANTPASPGGAANDARTQGDDLDSLLAQYETSVQPTPAAVPPPQPAAPPQPDVAALTSRIETLSGQVAEVNQIKFKADMASTVKEIRGDLDPEIFDDETVEAWLDGRARRDPRLNQAWLDRDTKPAQFRKIKAELGKQLAAKAKKLPDRAVTEDREAVSAAVRGTSTRAPESPPPNLSAMSDRELADYKDKLFGR